MSRMSRLLPAAFLNVCVLGWPVDAGATAFDFTTLPQAQAVNNAPVSQLVLGDLTLDAGPYVLTWDSRGGLGVAGGGYEDDEVEWPEVLELRWDGPVFLRQVTFALLFPDEPRDVGTFDEQLAYRVNGGLWQYFSAQLASGILRLDPNQIVESLAFAGIGAGGWTGGNPGSEASLREIEFDPAGVVPEPAVLLLLGVGGAAALARRRLAVRR